jgi:hypothetical protein
VLGTLPPYALAAPTFRFPALASLAGRRPLGGERETALAVFLGAHLASGALPPTSLPTTLRAKRASAGKSWLGALVLPAALRSLVSKLLEASGRDDVLALSQAVSAVADGAEKILDAASRRELEALARDLAALGKSASR